MSASPRDFYYSNKYNDDKYEYRFVLWFVLWFPILEVNLDRGNLKSEESY